MVNWHSLETVFLDMDGTLLDLHFDNHFWLEHLPSVTPSTIISARKKPVTPSSQ